MQHRYLDAPHSPLTEIVDTVSVIDLCTELTAGLNLPAPFSTEQSRYKSSNELLNRLFYMYVAENASAPTDNVKKNVSVRELLISAMTLSIISQIILSYCLLSLGLKVRYNRGLLMSNFRIRELF